MQPLNAPAFNAMLHQMGQDVLWHNSRDCPCRDARSGAASRNCPVCHGLGTFWGTPVQARIALAGQRVQAELQKFGEYVSGDVQISVPSDSPAYAANPGDRFTFIDSTVSRPMIVKRDAIIRERVVAVDYALAFVGNAVVDLPLPTIGEDGVITWPETLPTELVSLGLVVNPEYFLAPGYLQDRAHYGGIAYPRKAVLRKWDLWGRA